MLEDGWDDLLETGAGVEATVLGGARGDTVSRRRGQHPVHLGDDGPAERRDSVPPQHPNNGYFNGRTLRYTEHDRICVPVPFYHCFGCVMGNLGAVTHGACVVVPSEAFDPLAVLEVVSRERCTSLYGVPTMFIAALDEPRFAEFDLSSLRTGIMAGAPCPIEVMKRVRADMHMDEVTIACGMTETSPVSTQTAWTTRSRSASRRSVAHTRTSRSRSSTRPPARPSPAVSPASSAPAVTASCSATGATTTRQRARSTASGWMHTGDLSTMDEDGYVNIVGRIKDMIIRGGEIYPREIEEFLLTLEALSDAYVIGVPSERYGEEVMAWVKLRDGAEATPEVLVEACRGKIATYKIPRYWKFADSFPMTVTGKIQSSACARSRSRISASSRPPGIATGVAARLNPWWGLRPAAATPGRRSRSGRRARPRAPGRGPGDLGEHPGVTCVFTVS